MKGPESTQHGLIPNFVIFPTLPGDQIRRVLNNKIKVWDTVEAYGQ